MSRTESARAKADELLRRTRPRPHAGTKSPSAKARASLPLPALVHGTYIGPMAEDGGGDTLVGVAQAGETLRRHVADVDVDHSLSISVSNSAMRLRSSASVGSIASSTYAPAQPPPARLGPEAGTVPGKGGGGEQSWKAFYADDSSRAVCPACVWDYASRCGYCLAQKWSGAPRLHLPLLARRLLKINPNVTALELVDELARYGACGNEARRINDLIKFGAGKQETAAQHSQKYCLSHAVEMLDVNDRSAWFERELHKREAHLHEAEHAAQAAEDAAAADRAASDELQASNDTLRAQLRHMAGALAEEAANAAEARAHAKRLEDKLGKLETNKGTDPETLKLKRNSMHMNAQNNSLAKELADLRKQREADVAAAADAAEASRGAGGAGSGAKNDGGAAYETAETQTEWPEAHHAAAARPASPEKQPSRPASPEKQDRPAGQAAVAATAKSPMNKYLRRKPKGKLLTAAAAAELCAEILEKKAKADDVDEAEGNDKDTMPEFILDFFVQRYGLKKIVETKLVLFLHSLETHKTEGPLLALMAAIMGLDEPDLYSPLLSHVVVRALRTAFPEMDGIAEHLDEKGGKCLVSKKRAQASILGEAKADVHDKATWGCFELEHFATASQITRLHHSVVDLTDTGKANGSSGVDFMVVMALLTEMFLEESAEKIDALERVFVESDHNHDGSLDYQEFQAFLESTHMGNVTAAQTRRLFQFLCEDLHHDGNMDDDDAIVDARLFAVHAHRHGLYPQGVGEAIAD